MNAILLMSQAEARAVTDQIKSNLSQTRTLLLEMYEREGWRALGYASWREYGQAEFGYSESRIYQLMDAAKVERDISTIVENTGIIPESQLRPLASVPPDLRPELWQTALDTAPSGKMTAAHVEETVERIYRGPKRPMQNYTGSIYKPTGRDACQTPLYAVYPLQPYISNFQMIWEPAYGEGNILAALFDLGFRENEVTYSDILTGQNFFDYEPVLWDCIITNPPFSIKEEWLARCYELGKPFALLLPLSDLGLKGTQFYFKQYGLELIVFDKRVNFKMPEKGWDGSGAHFSTAWFTWGLNIGQQISFLELDTNES